MFFVCQQGMNEVIQPNSFVLTTQEPPITMNSSGQVRADFAWFVLSKWKIGWGSIPQNGRNSVPWVWLLPAKHRCSVGNSQCKAMNNFYNRYIIYYHMFICLNYFYTIRLRIITSYYFTNTVCTPVMIFSDMAMPNHRVPFCSDENIAFLYIFMDVHPTTFGVRVLGPAPEATFVQRWGRPAKTLQNPHMGLSEHGVYRYTF